MADLQHLLQNIMQDAQLREQMRQRDAVIDVVVRIISAAYDKSIAYTNLIIIAGYVTFYTAWGKLFDILPRFYVGLSGLFMTLSVIFFVGWEIYKMITSSYEFSGFPKLLAEKDPKKFQDNLAAYQKKEMIRNVRFSKIWYVVLLITIVPAVIGAGILIVNYAYYVIQSMPSK